MRLITLAPGRRVVLAIFSLLVIVSASTQICDATPSAYNRWKKDKRKTSARYEVIGRNETIIGVKLPPPWDKKPPGPQDPDFLAAQDRAWTILAEELDDVVATSNFPNWYIPLNSVESFESAPNIFRIYGLSPVALPKVKARPGISFVSNSAAVAQLPAPMRTGTGVYLHPAQIGLENVGGVSYTDVDGLEHISVKDVDVDILDAWQRSIGTPDTIVAIIDDEFETSLPEISANVFTNSKEKPCDGIDNDNNGFIDDYQGYNATARTGCTPDIKRKLQQYAPPRRRLFASQTHGTGMALTIASLPTRLSSDPRSDRAPVTGVSPGIQYLPISTGASIDDGLYHAYAYIIALRRAGVPIRVVNLSLGARHTDVWSCSPMTKDGSSLTVLGELLASGVTIVTAAGNDGNNNDRSFVCPSGLAQDYDSVISVGAVDPEGKLPFWSNFGPLSVTVSAPGTVIHNGYNFQTGTSPATALVSGTVALMYSANPRLTPKEVKEIIIDSVKLPELNLPTRTKGIISAGRAVSAAQGRRGPAFKKPPL